MAVRQCSIKPRKVRLNAGHVPFDSRCWRDCVAKRLLRLRLKRDSVDQDVIRGSGR
jgi:hypothetical protein